MSGLGERIVRLEKLKSTNSAPQASRTVNSAPKGFEPGTRYEGGAMVVTTPPLPGLDQADWPDAVRDSMGEGVPEGYRIRLAERRYYSHAWKRDPDDKGTKFSAYTGPAYMYRFIVEPDLGSISMDEIIKEIKSWRPSKKQAPTGSLTFLIAPGDLQLGKVDGTTGGTEGIVTRFLKGIDDSIIRLKTLRKLGYEIGDVHLALMGDCIEGYNSQGGRLAKRTDLNMTQMVIVYQRLVAHAIKLLAPLCESLVVVGIPGNHDEAVRTGDKMSTDYTDSWAVAGIVSVADSFSMVEELTGRDDWGHISFVFPRHDELTVTLDLSGTIVGFAHGHQFPNGSDGWYKWWAEQAQGQQQIGDAVLLIAGHKHNFRHDRPGAKGFIQVPSLDGGSQWWINKHGQDCPPGMVTALVGGGNWSHVEVHL